MTRRGTNASRRRQEGNVTSRSSMLSLGVGAIPAVAFTLHDLVFQLPDNQHEAQERTW